MKAVSSDKLVGAGLLAASVTIFVYYTLWVIVLVSALTICTAQNWGGGGGGCTEHTNATDVPWQSRCCTMAIMVPILASFQHESRHRTERLLLCVPHVCILVPLSLKGVSTSLAVTKVRDHATCASFWRWVCIASAVPTMICYFWAHCCAMHPVAGETLTLGLQKLTATLNLRSVCRD